MDFKNTERWNIIIPRSNCVGKKTTRVSQRFAFYFRKGVTITFPVQRSVDSREFVFKITCVFVLV